MIAKRTSLTDCGWVSSLHNKLASGRYGAESSITGTPNPRRCGEDYRADYVHAPFSKFSTPELAELYQPLQAGRLAVRDGF